MSVALSTSLNFSEHLLILPRALFNQEDFVFQYITVSLALLS